MENLTTITTTIVIRAMAFNLHCPSVFIDFLDTLLLVYLALYAFASLIKYWLKRLEARIEKQSLTDSLDYTQRIRTRLR